MTSRFFTTTETRYSVGYGMNCVAGHERRFETLKEAEEFFFGLGDSYDWKDLEKMVIEVTKFRKRFVRIIEDTTIHYWDIAEEFER